MGSALSFLVVFPCRSWFEGHELAGKLRAIQTVSCLLQGPSDAGNRVLELEGIMDGVLSLCASVCEAHQLVAVEALIHAADKAKRASFITANGVSLLKEIYKHSERDSIRIRALVVSAAGREERLCRALGWCWVGCGCRARSAVPSLLGGLSEAPRGDRARSCSDALLLGCRGSASWGPPEAPTSA